MRKDLSKLWTLQEVAEEMKKKPQTIYSWRQKGLPYKCKIGKTLYFDLEEVFDWVLNEFDYQHKLKEFVS